MIVRSLEDLQATGRYAEKPGVFTSARYLLREIGRPEARELVSPR